MTDLARDLPVLSLVVFTPVIGVLALLLVPGDRHRAIRWIALLASLVSLGLSLLLLGYEPDGAEFQFREDLEWIPAFGMGYRLGVDGLSVVLVILTTVLSVVSILYSWDPIQNRVKEYYATMLLLMVGMLGVFVSLDLFLFYVFWELSLIPMYLLIGIWGGPRRIYATIKFVIYTLVGSLLILVAILAVAVAYAAAGNPFRRPSLSSRSARSRATRPSCSSTGWSVSSYGASSPAAAWRWRCCRRSKGSCPDRTFPDSKLTSRSRPTRP